MPFSYTLCSVYFEHESEIMGKQRNNISAPQRWVLSLVPRWGKVTRPSNGSQFPSEKLACSLLSQPLRQSAAGGSATRSCNVLNSCLFPY